MKDELRRRKARKFLWWAELREMGSFGAGRSNHQGTKSTKKNDETEWVTTDGHGCARMKAGDWGLESGDCRSEIGNLRFSRGGMSAKGVKSLKGEEDRQVVAGGGVGMRGGFVWRGEIEPPGHQEHQEEGRDGVGTDD
jgi:hypothetical protein